MAFVKLGTIARKAIINTIYLIPFFFFIAIIIVEDIKSAIKHIITIQTLI